MRVRVYGPSRGHGSWPRVARGLCEGLAEAGALAGFSPVDELGHQLDDALDAGWDADLGVYVGPPPLGSVMRSRGRHEHRLVMIALNSTWAPRTAMAALERDDFITGYLAPSAWAKRVLERHTTLPVHLWHHGVGRAFCEPAGRSEREHYSCLHLASTHNDRKGTREVVQAWASLVGHIIPPDSRLRLVCDGPRGHYNDLLDSAFAASPLRESVELSPRLDLPEAEMAAVLRQHDLVCQPSRAEGFGMVPLEARAVGVPVCATACTGHADHLVADGAMPPLATPLEVGVQLVLHGLSAPIDDGPGAEAPIVTVDAVRYSLERAYCRRGDLALAARRHASWVGEHWSWGAVTRRFLREVQL